MITLLTLIFYLAIACACIAFFLKVLGFVFVITFKTVLWILPAVCIIGLLAFLIH